MDGNLYDNIAARYEERFVKEKYAGIIFEINAVIESNNFTRILEIGCGTGYWLRNVSKRKVVKTGIDFSLAMLSAAKQKDGTSLFVCANALALPVKDNSFEVIFLINALHQISDWRAVFSTAKKILSEKGKLMIVGIFPDEPEFRWYVHDYFPEVKKRDLERYQSKEEIGEALLKTGFRNVAVKKIYAVEKLFAQEEILSDPFLERHNSSQLAQLEDNLFETGMEKIRNDIKNNKEIIFETKIPFYSITADV
ncbi:MAG: methyltransferase domain-containing protein [Chlorobi bacterium]|nr:methyltransferase domain-containing protein [Chlorobiota bacterium]